MTNVDDIKKAPIDEVVNAMLERGHLSRLSSNKVKYLCGSKNNGLFAHLSKNYTPPKIKISFDVRLVIDRGYSLSNTPFFLLTNREKDCFVWVRKKRATLEEQGGYEEVSILDILDEASPDLIEDLILNIDLMS